ncbi:hypothetical protein BDR26DRAFT_1008757 [Obelidium mucronatum]|nr:hypothetical protein BDR26DRAFT_1008757 [Obelidium mucronatum]
MIRLRVTVPSLGLKRLVPVAVDGATTVAHAAAQIAAALGLGFSADLSADGFVLLATAAAAALLRDGDAVDAVAKEDECKKKKEKKREDVEEVQEAEVSEKKKKRKKAKLELEEPVKIVQVQKEVLQVQKPVQQKVLQSQSVQQNDLPLQPVQQKSVPKQIVHHEKEQPKEQQLQVQKQPQYQHSIVQQQLAKQLPPAKAIHTYIELYDDIPSPVENSRKRGRKNQANNNHNNTSKNKKSELIQPPLDYGDDEFSTPVTILTKDYSSFPKIDVSVHLPPVGSLIAFKTLEMGSDFTPQLSAFKEASILEIHPKTKTMTLLLAGQNGRIAPPKQLAPRRRKNLTHYDWNPAENEDDDVEGEGEVEDGEEEGQVDYEYVLLDELNGVGDGKITLGWRDLVDPRTPLTLDYTLHINLEGIVSFH